MSFFSEKPSSKEIANKRLKLILINDKHGVSLKLIEVLKFEISNAIESYFEVDKSAVEIKVVSNLIENANSTMLVVNMPIKKVFR